MRAGNSHSTMRAGGNGNASPLPGGATPTKQQQLQQQQQQHPPLEDYDDDYDPSASRRPRHDGAAIVQRGLGAAPPSEHPYKGQGPTMEGLAKACFQDGLLYRIVNGDVWGFYNDTFQFEMHVVCCFGPDSRVTPLGHAVADRDQEGWLRFRIVVYPAETKTICKGSYRGFRFEVAAKPLSAAYRERANRDADTAVKAEFDALVQLAHGRSDPEKVLASCVRQNVPFVDLQFPPNATSLSPPNDPSPLPRVAWLRPRAITAPRKRRGVAMAMAAEAAGAPRVDLFKDDIAPTDIGQGQLGDCWFLGAVAAMADYPASIRRIFVHPGGEEAAKAERGVGAYRVTLNKNGWWSCVVVDDYLPCTGNVPCFARNKHDPTELWVSLIEKAYAKLHRTYGAIVGGDVMLALGDLTGAPTMRYDGDWNGDEKAAKQVEEEGRQHGSPLVDVSRQRQRAIFRSNTIKEGSTALSMTNRSGMDGAASAESAATASPLLPSRSSFMPQLAASTESAQMSQLHRDPFAPPPESLYSRRGTLAPGTGPPSMASGASAAPPTKRNAALFLSIKAHVDRGFVVLLNTPDSASPNALRAHGIKSSQVLESIYESAGLGMAQGYAVLDAKAFPEKNVYLLKIRNPWSEGVEWTGAWSDQSAKWHEYPGIATKCGFRAIDDATFWMEWDDAQVYFDGGGVCFASPQAPPLHDYRVRGDFDNGFPTVGLLIRVMGTQSVDAMVTLSQVDERSVIAGVAPYYLTAGGNASAANARPPTTTAGTAATGSKRRESEYLAAMVAICTPHESKEQRFHVTATSGVDPLHPAKEYSFVHARDCAVRWTFTPNARPYLVLPRVYNAYAMRSYVLGLRSDEPIRDGVLKVEFIRLHPDCNFYKNYGTFRQLDGHLEGCQADHQYYSPHGVVHAGYGYEFISAPTAPL
jgi:hypothetical protein